MKERSSKRRKRSFMAGLLAFVLTVTSVLPGFPAMQVKAAEAKVWCRMTGAGSTHNYGNPNADANGNVGKAFLHNKSKKMPIGGKFTFTYMLEGTNANVDHGFFYTYLDDQHWLYVGHDASSKWYYQWQNGSDGAYAVISGLPEPELGVRTTVSVSLNNEVLVVQVGDFSKNIPNDKFQAVANHINGQGKFGFYSRSGGQLRFTDAKLGTTAIADGKSDWQFLVARDGASVDDYQQRMHTVKGKVKDANDTALADATVRIGQDRATTKADGTFSMVVEEGSYTVSVSKKGYNAYSSEEPVEINADKTLADIALETKQEVAYGEDQWITNVTGDPGSITEEPLRVAVSKTFPQVHKYELGTGANKKTMIGQERALNKININGEQIPVTPDPVTIRDNKATYPIKIDYHKDAVATKDPEPAKPEVNIKLDMVVEISVEDNDLTWKVTKLEKKEGCDRIHTIGVDNLNLVTIEEGTPGAQFMGANVSGDVNASGDEEITFEKRFIADNSQGYAYGFLSGDGISAGVWSNSEMPGDRRLLRNNGIDSISLTSASWWHEYQLGGAHDFSPAQYTEIPVSELPCVKVCLAKDLNDDEKVDWQDGAIAYRDIMNNPYGSENTPELVNYRISMNFSSQATNPYMKVADNIKKVYLATDGLPQAVMMKGYGSEGHDSANSEYGHISDRLGGADELKKLNVIAHQYNTQTGIHINAYEAYPEAKTFSDDLIVDPSSKGWGWLDQSYIIDGAYDLGSGLRYKRLLQLYDQLNGTDLYKVKWPNEAGKNEPANAVADADTIAKTVQEHLDNQEDLDFMYLDVWHGNSWETRKIAQQFNSLGWRFSTEFGNQGEYDTTWNHWATEGSYGGATGKGFNSDVMRFIRNHQRDSYVLNWPAYGGTADNPLLGGFDLAGFEGWGSNNNFDEYITKTFAINLPTKFLQHYKVYNWENYPDDKDGNTTSPTGNHEKQITLRSDADENGNYDTVVVTRKPKEEQRPAVDSADIPEEDRLDTDYNFVERTITLNGRKVLDDVEYLLPWYDEEKKEEKLYYYNYDGFEPRVTSEPAKEPSVWELPEDWADLANVKVYELTDMGRGAAQTVNVTKTGDKATVTFSGSIVKADTPYVVVKGDSDVTARTVDSWSDHTHVTDSGFNSYAGTGEGSSLDSNWTNVSGSAKVVRVESGNKYLQMGNATAASSASTKIKDLTANTNYVAQVYVENKSDVKASISVNAGGKDVSEYTLRSLANNYVRCDAHNMNAVEGSKMQVMQVPFTTGANETEVTLTLAREAGAGITYFDDIRIVKETPGNVSEDGSFVQDFENVVSGIYPFVVGDVTGVNDNLVHLSEKHAPYTQAGWGNVVLDDVIEGKWSLKYRRSQGGAGMLFRTIPQNLHFEAGKTYEVSFDYEAGAENAFFYVTGDENKETYAPTFLPNTPYDATAKKVEKKTCTFQMTGADSGQSWFGIRVANNSATGDYGQKDFVLDNLRVRELPVSITPASTTLTDATNPIEIAVSLKEGQNANSVEWASSDEDVAYVVKDATDPKKAKAYMTGFGDVSITATVTVGTGDAAETFTLTSTISFPETYELPENQRKTAKWTDAYANTVSDPVSGAIDTNEDGTPKADTFWQSAWSSNAWNPANGPALLTVKAETAFSDLNRLRFATRSGNAHGIISKYKVVVGSTFDEATNTISNPSYTSEEIVPANYRDGVNSLSETHILPEGVSGQYVQLQILEATGDAATVATIELDKVGSYRTEANLKPMAFNSLKAAVAAAKDIQQGDYSANSWNKFVAAYNTAVTETNKTSTDKTSTELTKLKKDLQDAIDGLKTAVEEAQDNLAIALEEAEPIATMADSGYYVEAKWNTLKTAYDAANSGKDGTDVSTLNTLLANLTSALEGLTFDTAKMDADKAEAAKIGEKEQGHYTQATWNAYVAACNAVNNAASGISNEDMAELLLAMKAAESQLALDPTAVKADANKAYAEASAEIEVGQGNYDDESWSAYEEAYNALKAEIEKGTSANTQNLENLQNALAEAKANLALKNETAVKDAADQALKDSAPIYNAGSGNYDADSWKVYEDAYKALDEALKAQNPDPKTLNDLQRALEQAANALQLNKDKVSDSVNTTLEAEKAAESATSSAYTAESWKAYHDAYAALKNAMADESTTAEKLLELQDKLNKAKAGLVKISAPKPDPNWQPAKNKLTAALSAAAPYSTGGKKDWYTDAQWNAFTSAYNAANAQRNATTSVPASRLTSLATALDNARLALVNASKLENGKSSVEQGGIQYVLIDAVKKTARVEKGLNKKTLKAVNIPATVTIKGVACTVTEIKQNAFKKFTKITKVTIGKNVTKIGKSAFNGCSAMTTLTVSGDVKTFDAQAFAGCKKLKTINFKGKKVPTFKSKVFKGTSAKMTVKLSKTLKKGKNKKNMTTRLKRAGISKKAKIK